jgi:hypothetical protein
MLVAYGTTLYFSAFGLVLTACSEALKLVEGRCIGDCLPNLRFPDARCARENEFSSVIWLMARVWAGRAPTGTEPAAATLEPQRRVCSAPAGARLLADGANALGLAQIRGDTGTALAHSDTALRARRLGGRARCCSLLLQASRPAQPLQPSVYNPQE